MPTFERTIAVTGGAGFIGANLLQMLADRYSHYLFINVDCLTYAGNLANLAALEAAANYRFEKIDIRSQEDLGSLFLKYQIDGVIHLAAESHVDRSIIGPGDFVQTNIVGTFNLLELVREMAESGRNIRFHLVSTDEVYGSIEGSARVAETDRYDPSSPYSASKAAADHLTRAYHRTYGIDVVLSNCTNNYGPFQFPEKLIPLVIYNAKSKKEIPVYGDGAQVRDWLHVEDHCEALDMIFHRGEAGETYNVSSHVETRNLDLVRMICRLADSLTGSEKSEELISHVSDRPGHYFRYALDSSKLRESLGWRPAHSLEDGLRETVEWYSANSEWVDACMTGEYKTYYDRNYSNR